MEQLVSQVGQDVRFAWRTINRARGTMAVAVLCLALGVGANTAIFSVVRAVLLQSLPYGDPERLVNVNESFYDGGELHRGSVAPPNFFLLRGESRVFADAAGYLGSTRDLGDVAQPEHLQGVRATFNLFAVLGARPLRGRTFVAADTEPGAPAAVVISEALWRRSFGGDPALVGSSITLGGVKLVVVGVMPETFDFPVGVTHNDYWTPLEWKMVGGTVSRRNHSLQVVARLVAGADSASATRALDRLAQRLVKDYPKEQSGRSFLVTSVTANVVGKVRPALLVLLGAVALVLLIACANVANLLLARAAGRRREIAIRTALGAERLRLVRQMLTESALLALMGGVLGLVVAQLSIGALVRLAAATLPRAASIQLDASVLAFAFVVALATGLLFGIVPALRASSTDLREDLSDAAGRTTAGAARHKTLNALIAAEIALSLVLLVGAGLVIRSFIALLDTDAGFRAERVLTFHATPPAGAVIDSQTFAHFYGPVLERLRQSPDVRAAGLTSVLPIADGATDRYFGIVGRPTDSTRIPDAEARVVSSDYFRALAVPVLVGREFADRDDATAPQVVIVNDRLAQQYFPSQNPIGQRLTVFGGTEMTIVGVVKAVRQFGLDQEAKPELYVPVTQQARQMGPAAFVVATRGDPASLAATVRTIVHDVAPQQPVFQVATMSTVVSRSLAGRRLVLVLLGTFALLALVLSAAGVYGVMSYAVSQRTREIGIRIALGARARDVAWMVLRNAGGVAGAGVAAGLVGAVLLTRVLRGIIYGVGAYDPLTFIVAPALIALVAIAAGMLPAARAARVDPLDAIRAE